jgi:hypothetical protein
MKRGALIFLVLLVIVSLVFTGCNNTTEKVRKLSNYIGGNDGLTIAFSKNAPPDTVLDEKQEDFDVSLDIQNKGEYTIESGEIIATLSGIDREAFNLPSLNAKNAFQLERKINDRGVTREGGRNDLTFGLATFTQDLAADFTTDIVADVCYKYRTVAVSAVCLKMNTLQLKTTDACLIDNDKVEFENSGAPVQITQVETRKSGKNSVKVTFTIENKGVGEVYVPGTFTDSCSGHEKDEARVRVSLDSPSSRLTFKCDLFNGAAAGDVKIYDKKRQVGCVIDTGSLQETAFEAVVNIQVDYVYRNAIFKQIIIQNTNVL